MDTVFKRYHFEKVQDSDGEYFDFECTALRTTNGDVYLKLRDFSVLLGFDNITKAHSCIPKDCKISWWRLKKKLDIEFDCGISSKEAPTPGTLFVDDIGLITLTMFLLERRGCKYANFICRHAIPSIRFDRISRVCIKDGYVYVSTNSEYSKNDIYLIDVSFDPDHSLSTLNKAHAYDELHCVQSYNVGDYCFEAGSMLSEVLKSYRIKGDFYRLGDKEMKLIRDTLCNIENMNAIKTDDE
ncbi:Bro23 [Heliothis virescens ascovirus 3e]|uniref:Bro23 n=1 Tax=Heliothis virescens ascovirus 3e TaxID=260797 RepID=A4KXM1_HVAVE|nr:Bro23 [Heliothis virescens ascovirus 3e]ABO37352.1 Bro23 [Heliothis virescens ascovirus 3e]